MGLREQIIIAKYVLKNNVVNPVLRYRMGRLYLVLMLVGLGLLVYSAASLGTSGSSELRVDIVNLLHGVGLTRSALVDVAASVMLLLGLAAVALAKPYVTVAPYEYELVLAQPITARDLVLGKTWAALLWELLSAPYLVSVIFMALMLAPSPDKAAVAAIAIVLASLYLSLLPTSAQLLSLRLARRGLRRTLGLAAAAYAAAGLAHSLLLHGASPLLSLPLRPLAASLVLSFSSTSSLPGIVHWLLLSLTIPAVLAACIAVLSAGLSVEELKPVTLGVPGAARRHRAGPGRARRLARLGSGSPRDAVMEAVYYSRVATLGHLAKLAAVIGLGVAAAEAARLLLPPGRLGVASFAVTVFVPLNIALMLSSVVDYVLAVDLVTTLWLYRVYSADMRPLAEALMARIFTVIMEAVLVLSLIIVVLTAEPLSLLILPVSALPATLASFASMAAASYFASKRRIVREIVPGRHAIESLPSILIELAVAASVTASTLLVQLLLASRMYSVLVLLSLLSMAGAAVAAYALAALLADLMSRYDVLI